jgi:hypothetical protein
MPQFTHSITRRPEKYMRLDEEQESQNIEDRRGSRVSRGVVGDGIGTVAIVLIALFFGVDPSILLQGNLPEQSVPQTSSPQSQRPGGEDEMRQFVARVLGSTERTWTQIFEAGGRTYDKPTLVLSRMLSSQPVASLRRRQALSTADPITKFISTSLSTAICASASRRPATSPRLT